MVYGFTRLLRGEVVGAGKSSGPAKEVVGARGKSSGPGESRRGQPKGKVVGASQSDLRQEVEFGRLPAVQSISAT